MSFLRPQSSARTPSDAISLTGKVPLNRPSKLVRVASFLLREQFTVVFFQPRVEKQNPGLGALPSNHAQIAEASGKHALLRRFPSRQSLPSGLSTNSNLRLCLDSTRLRCPTPPLPLRWMARCGLGSSQTAPRGTVVPARLPTRT